ncbi:hypothetical protein [uncultured Sphingomonas sp.]|uniref:hypothetical protein n=1 Tax=uncultured Sphingomonas sp. TaxID=158754 RepID=UPI002625AFDE|nr:hypothetical protein [uncultured Sphingomonas sp.]
MAGFRISHLGASVALAALALAGCNRTPAVDQALLNNQSAIAPLPDLPATLPMVDGPATPATFAPRVTSLPETRPIRTVRVRDAASGAGYAYANAAYGFADALGEAPPDYGFDYQGVEPWAWQAYDDSIVFVEPVAGGYRSYYYRPGADEPYFIRCPDYSYGYANGQLAVVYAVDGAIIPWADYGPQVIYASRYLVRGRDMWRASRDERLPINAANWADRRTGWFEARLQWGAARARQPLWESYAQTNAAAESHWRTEQVRRGADARRFATWQSQGFRSAPPPRAIPVQWQQASWARNPDHFAPAAAAITGGAVASGAVMAHNAAIAAQRQQEEQQARLADAARVQQEQARMLAQRQQAMQMQTAHLQQARVADTMQRRQQQAVRFEQQQAHAAETMQRRQQQAVRFEQQQTRTAEMTQRRQQQAVRFEQQQAHAAETMQRRQQQAVRFEQQQTRAAEMTQRREQQARAADVMQYRQQQAAQMERQQAARMEQQQARMADMARREQAGAARAQEMQARAQQQQARASESFQRAQMQAPRVQEQPAPRPAAPPHEHPERPHEQR